MEENIIVEWKEYCGGGMGIVERKGNCGGKSEIALFCVSCAKISVFLWRGNEKTHLVVLWGKEVSEYSQTFLSLSWGPTLGTVYIWPSLQVVCFFPNMGAHVCFLKDFQWLRGLKSPRGFGVFEGAKGFGRKRTLG